MTPDEEGPRPAAAGRLRTTGAGLVAGWALAGVLIGRMVRPGAIELGLAVPRVGWVQTGALYLVAAILAVVARATHRTVQVRRGALRPHEAVNRLVLAKACALVGALMAGGYLGYALAWVGSDAEPASQRIVVSLVAAAGAALVVVGSLLLERACRIRSDEDET